MSRDKKLIYFLVALIIFLAIILLIKIKITPKYDPKIYDEIYDEYDYIFEEEDDRQENEGNNSIIDENNSQRTDITTITSNTNQGNVIGKIIIPKIEIIYPIIKETTAEYLKVAPTKYCGPEVNGIRKFSYSGA